MSWNKVTLVGVGLLGGSLGLALKARRLAHTVHGYVRREASVAECLKAGVADQVTLDLAEAVREADLVVLSTPLAQMRGLVERLLPHLQPGAILTDVGSVKGSVVQDVEPLFSGGAAEFVGSHPMAGAEKMGVSAARADLFVNAVCVVTPTPKTTPGALARVRGLWEGVGGRVMELPPGLHDELVARCSHLPHVTAALLAHHVLCPSRPAQQSVLCATGFRDTTRVASGSPEMWRDIVLANRREILSALEAFAGEMDAFRGMVERGEAAAIEAFFVKAKTRRDQWCAPNASPSPE